jgi:hypothetical protein
VLYVAMGEYVEEAAISARSAREHMDVPVAIITDESPDYDCFDIVIDCDDPRYGFADKVNNLHRTPFDRTLFLDTDIYVARPVSDVFAVLERKDVAVAHDVAVKAPMDGYTRARIPAAYPEFNSGVIGYAGTDAADSVLRDYWEIYSSANYTVDQPALRRALYENDEAQVCVLPDEYNCRWTICGQVSDTVRLFHGRLYDFDGEIDGLDDTPTDTRFDAVDYAREAEKTLNGRMGLRVFTGEKGRVRVQETEHPE